jgi:hypothetical protein
MTRFKLWMGLLALAMALAAGGCVRVKPWQRENLARKSMAREQSRGETRFEGHVREAREGASGGTGEAGAGCGCN